MGNPTATVTTVNQPGKRRGPTHSSFFSYRLSFIVSTTLAALSLSACYSFIQISDVANISEAPAITRLVTAHRGSLHRGFPDNSLPALAEAIEAKVPLLEVDVRLSETSRALFLFHDGSLSGSNSFAPESLIGKKISSLTETEREAVFLNKDKTIRIPLLSEALSLVINQKPGYFSRLQLDLKGESDELLAAIVSEVLRLKAERGVVIQLRDPKRVKRLKAEYPALSIIARCKNHKDLVSALENKADIVELERWITAEAVALAHSSSTPILINVSNSHLDTTYTHNYLRVRGVDIIMTDRAAD